MHKFVFSIVMLLLGALAGIVITPISFGQNLWPLPTALLIVVSLLLLVWYFGSVYKEEIYLRSNFVMYRGVDIGLPTKHAFFLPIVAYAVGMMIGCAPMYEASPLPVIVATVIGTPYILFVIRK